MTNYHVSSGARGVEDGGCVCQRIRLGSMHYWFV
jgi:hypothetical protein